MSTAQQVPQKSTLRSARRIAIILIIGSLTIAAIVGIVTLLSGTWGQTQAKVLLTTLFIGGFSITVLCDLAVVGRALRVVGFLGFVASAAALVVGLVLIWGEWGFTETWGNLLKAFGVLSIVAVSFSHANLLLLLGQRRNRVVRILLYVTVVLIALVAVLLSVPIATGFDIPGPNGDGYWRLVGVVAILDALGTIVLPVTGKFLREDAAPVEVAKES